VPVERIPWSQEAGVGLVFAGRLSPEKGAREAIEIALRAGEQIDLYGHAYDTDYARVLEDRYGASQGVRFHRPVPRPELWQRLSPTCGRRPEHGGLRGRVRRALRDDRGAGSDSPLIDRRSC